MPPIFVINLKRSTQRRAAVEAQLDSMGLSHTFIEAVDGKNLQPDDLKTYAPIRRRLFFGKDLMLGEIGCILSHRKIYQQVTQQKIPYAIVLEDDVIISPDFPELINALVKIPVKWDLIRLIGNKKAYKKSRHLGFITNKYSLMRLKRPIHTAYAYILNLNAAQRLLNLTQTNWVPVDTVHAQPWRTQLCTFCVSPSPVSVIENESTIGQARFSEVSSLTGWEKCVGPLMQFGMKLYISLCARVFTVVVWPKDLSIRKKLRQ